MRDGCCAFKIRGRDICWRLSLQLGILIRIRFISMMRHSTLRVLTLCRVRAVRMPFFRRLSDCIPRQSYASLKATCLSAPFDPTDPDPAPAPAALL